jgi:hypothetical protein
MRRANTATSSCEKALRFMEPPIPAGVAARSGNLDLEQAS